MSHLRVLPGFLGVFEGPARMFVGREMVFFSVVDGGGEVSVRGQIMEFCGSLMRVVGHGFSLGVSAYVSAM